MSHKKPSQDINNKNENIIDESAKNDIETNVTNDNEYTFVQERILTRRSRIFRFFGRVFWNFMIPVCVCLVVCYIYFSFMDDDEPVKPVESNTENSIIVKPETDDNKETSTGETDKKPNINNPDNLDVEENLVKLEEMIKKMVVVVSVVRENESEQLVEKHTGVVVSMYGPVYILIQYENIKDYQELYVHVGDDIVLETTVYDIDYVTGLALLKVEKSKVTADVLDKISVATFKGVNKAIEGMSIIYCGNVVGNAPMFMKGHISNSSNFVSCIDRRFNMLITDIMFETAKDGFLFNSKGNLIGIVGVGVGQIELPEVVAGARALDLAYIINNMLNGKKDIYFGITGQEVSAKIEEIAGGSMPRGIYVSNVEIDSPAYDAGIMPGDIIYIIGNISEPDMDKFSSHIEGKSKGDTVNVWIKRRIGTEYNMYDMSVTLDYRD